MMSSDNKPQARRPGDQARAEEAERAICEVADRVNYHLTGIRLGDLIAKVRSGKILPSDIDGLGREQSRFVEMLLVGHWIEPIVMYRKESIWSCPDDRPAILDRFVSDKLELWGVVVPELGGMTFGGLGRDRQRRILDEYINVVVYGGDTEAVSS